MIKQEDNVKEYIINTGDVFFPPIGGFLPFWGDFWGPNCLKSAKNLTNSAHIRPF